MDIQRNSGTQAKSGIESEDRSAADTGDDSTIVRFAKKTNLSPYKR